MAQSSDKPVSEWPEEEEGLTIHYKPDISTPPAARGILHYTSRGKPAAHWQLLIDTVLVACSSLNDLAYLLPKEFDQAKKDEIQRDLKLAFRLAFPGKEDVSIKLTSGDVETQKGTWIEFHTPSSNVPASETATVAFMHGWKADGLPLLKPFYVGLQTTELLHPIMFSSVPGEHKKAFIAALQQFLTRSLDPSHEIEVLDIWENQKRIASPGGGQSSWQFEGEIMALIRVQAPYPPKGDMELFADWWPGWFHFDNEYLVELEYPGRFDYCVFCMHIAQDLQGATQRHTSQACVKLICRNCGHHGHDSGLIDPSGSQQRACEEGRRQRLEERASKRQKETHDGAAQPATQSTGATLTVQTVQTVQAQAAASSSAVTQSEGQAQSDVVVKTEASR